MNHLKKPPTPEGLRIRMVTPGFPPARGGVEEHCRHLATRFAQDGDQVSVLTASRTEPVGTSHRTDGVEVRTYRAWQTGIMSISGRLTLAGLTDPAGASDILHVHSYHASTGFAALAGLRRPVVFTPHYHGTGHSPLARKLHRGYRLLGRAMFSAADAIICVSEAEKRAVIVDFPAVADRIRVIPNGVDRAAIRAAEPFDDQPPTVLVVGRLEPYKGVAAVIEAMSHLPEPTQLIVIGTGSQSEELARRARDAELGSRVRILGAVGTLELHRWMRTAQVLVSLSDHEAFGMVPLEAATAGSRVVLSEIPAHREISDRYLGPAAQLIAPDSSPAAVADALRRSLLESERVRVDVPDWSDVAQATRSVYRDMLGHHRSPIPTRDQLWSTT